MYLVLNYPIKQSFAASSAAVLIFPANYTVYIMKQHFEAQSHTVTALPQYSMPAVRLFSQVVRVDSKADTENNQ